MRAQQTAFVSKLIKLSATTANSRREIKQNDWSTSCDPQHTQRFIVQITIVENILLNYRKS